MMYIFEKKNKNCNIQNLQCSDGATEDADDEIIINQRYL